MKYKIIFFLHIALFLSFLTLVSCGFFQRKFDEFGLIEHYKRPLMNREDRYYYIVDYGYNLTWDIKNAFIEGKIIPGMPWYLVEIMYGEPDLKIKCPGIENLVCDDIKVYQTNNTETVGSASVKAGNVVKSTGQLEKNCRY